MEYTGANILIKSFVIFLAWIFSFIAIKKLPISLYGVLDLSRVIFAFSSIADNSSNVRTASTIPS